MPFIVIGDKDYRLMPHEEFPSILLRLTSRCVPILQRGKNLPKRGRIESSLRDGGGDGGDEPKRSLAVCKARIWQRSLPAVQSVRLISLNDGEFDPVFLISL